jgi:dTDP-4-dehydrorhamnose 3,5-epimerase-like enzyme
MTNYRDSKLEKGILWNDSSIKIKWPVKRPIISIKDKKNMTFNEYIENYE